MLAFLPERCIQEVSRNPAPPSRSLCFLGREVGPNTHIYNGQQALDQIEASPFNLVILDVMMPKLDGFMVCQRVREFSSVPIIIVTARGQDQDKVHGLDLGADDYLTKPFSVEE
jgi:DNA-binding response OmpR family regulator